METLKGVTNYYPLSANEVYSMCCCGRNSSAKI